MLDMVRERLESFGYVLNASDKALIAFSVQKVENTIKNECSVLSVPEGLINIAVDMGASSFIGVFQCCPSHFLRLLYCITYHLYHLSFL